MPSINICVLLSKLEVMIKEKILHNIVSNESHQDLKQFIKSDRATLYNIVNITYTNMD